MIYDRDKNFLARKKMRFRISFKTFDFLTFTLILNLKSATTSSSHNSKDK